MKGHGLLSVGVDVTPESAVLARVEVGEIAEVLDVLPYSAESATALLAKRDTLRATDARADALEVLACSHDCEANATYVLTDGPLGHGWERRLQRVPTGRLGGEI